MFSSCISVHDFSTFFSCEKLKSSRSLEGEKRPEEGWEAREVCKTGGQKVEAETWGEAQVLWDTKEILLWNGA